MRNLSWLNFLVFTCCLVIGYSYSTRFFPHDSTFTSDFPTVLAANENPLESMPNGQRSLLLIAASGIHSATPQLESIWLASYIPSDPIIRIMPIIPSNSGLTTSFEDQLRQTFHLTENKGHLIPDQAFMNVLRANNFWWSGYFIFDDLALASLASKNSETMPQGNIDWQLSASNSHTDELPASPAGFSAHLNWIQTACQQLIRAGQVEDLSQKLLTLSDHILTDMDLDQIQQEWDSLHSSQQNPACRFPTLEISRLEP